ncbi:MAG: NAD(P)-dependent oxidoreductase [Bacteroidota bacterium]
MKRVLVFGGTGFLGEYLVEDLLLKGFDVYAADLQLPKYFDTKRFKNCDILNSKQVSEIIDGNYDFVYNLAGFSSLDRAINDPYSTVKLNIMGNLNILEAVKNLGSISRFIYASSAYAVNNKGSFYGISKLSSEKLIEEYQKRYGLKYTILRYGSVYSERGYDNNYIYHIIKEAILAGKIDHPGDGEEIREYIHAADAARLSVDILSDDFINQNVILTGAEKMRRLDLFRMIEETLGSKVKINFSKDGYANHYRITPYSFHPTLSRKLIANPYIDMGQGILECIKEVHKNNQADQ